MRVSKWPQEGILRLRAGDTYTAKQDEVWHSADRYARAERDALLKEARDTKDAIVNEAKSKAKSKAKNSATWRLGPDEYFVLSVMVNAMRERHGNHQW